MAFPTTAFTDPTAALSAFMNKATENGLSGAVADGFDAATAATLANFFSSLPAGARLTPSEVTITAAGAIPLTAGHVVLTPPDSSSYAVTLAAPGDTAVGSVMVIEADSAPGGAVTLALTNVVGQSSGTSASFDAANELLVLVAADSKWVVVGEAGVTLS